MEFLFEIRYSRPDFHSRVNLRIFTLIDSQEVRERQVAELMTGHMNGQRWTKIDIMIEGVYIYGWMDGLMDGFMDKYRYKQTNR